MPQTLQYFTGSLPIRQFDFSKRSRQTRTTDNSLSLREFIQRVNPRFKFYPHLEILIDVLQRVADGDLRRLMIFLPPRHGKSETVSRLFSAYYVYRHPERFVGLTSYAAGLAYTLSRNARENYLNAGGTLTVEGVEQWETGQGGGLWAAGVGGPITGKGGHLLLVDDPLKNAEDAASETIREKQKEWWKSTFYTREEPGGSIVIIQTRWHEDDLSGWLLSREHEDEEAEPERWHIVLMPAVMAELPRLPDTVTIEPDPRQPGEALAPDRYPLKRLATIRRNSGSYFWSALYQQWPIPPEGDTFKREWFQYIDRISDDEVVRWVRYWDKAGSTSKSAKYTAGVKVGITKDRRIIIAHVVRGKWSTGNRRKVMRQTAQIDGIDVTVGIEQEPGSSGLDSVRDEKRLLMGYTVFSDTPTGDKDTRLRPFAAQAEAQNVYLVKGSWNEAYIDELCALPNGTYRDQSDATAGAFNRLVRGGIDETMANSLFGWRS